jgi:hypothetical protein
MKKQNYAVLVGGLLVLVGFFMGWLGLRGDGGSFSISGWEMFKIAKSNGAIYYLLYLLPLGALVAGIAALAAPAVAARIGIAVGAIFLLWGSFEVLRVLYYTTFGGLWLTVGGLLVLLIGGLATLKSK